MAPKSTPGRPYCEHPQISQLPLSPSVCKGCENEWNEMEASLLAVNRHIPLDSRAINLRTE